MLNITGENLNLTEGFDMHFTHKHRTPVRAPIHGSVGVLQSIFGERPASIS
jgi:hypothetical protein